MLWRQEAEKTIISTNDGFAYASRGFELHHSASILSSVF